MRRNREEFNQLVEKQRNAKKATSRNPEKEKLRETLERDVVKFLATGKEITEIPTLEPLPRQPCKKPQPYPRRNNPTAYAETKYNAILRKWCEEVKGRKKRLAELTDRSATWYSMRCKGSHIFRSADYEVIRSAMLEIEKEEAGDVK